MRHIFLLLVISQIACSNTLYNEILSEISGDVPTLTLAETLDSDLNGKIDHYRLTFNAAMQDSSFPGYKNDSEGQTTSEWMVAGHSNIRLSHGKAAPESDSLNDEVLYIKFDENSNNCNNATQSGCDSGTLPDLTTSASPQLQLLTQIPFGQINSNTVNETDNSPAIVIAAQSTGTNSLRLIFSEAVDAKLSTCSSSASCQKLYSITSNLNVNAANRDTILFNQVNLTTGPQTESLLYTITSTQIIQDLAGLPLSSTKNSTTFQGLNSPTLVSATATAYNKVQITFSETILSGSTTGSAECSNAIQCATLYSINGLTVLSSLSTNGSGNNSTTFVLTTSEQSEAVSYTVVATAGQIKDSTDNTAIGTSANSATFTGDGLPIYTINSTSCTGTLLTINFDQSMTSATATASSADFASNYQIISCTQGACSGASQTATTAVYSASQAVLTFATGLSQDGTSLYTLSISNVEDSKGNAITTPTNTLFQCGADTLSPILLNVALQSQLSNETRLQLTFNENLDLTTSQTTINYKIDTLSYGTNIISATRQSNQSIVELVIQPALSRGGHVISVLNVTDTSSNAISQEQQQPFTIDPPTTFDEGPVFTDPFADQVTASQIFVYDSKIYIGPNANHDKVFEVSFDMTSAKTITLDADSVIGPPYSAFKNYTSSYSCNGSCTVSGIDVFYAGCAGASPATLTGASCSSAGGAEYLFAGAFNTTGNYRSYWSTQDNIISTYTFAEKGNGFAAGTVTFRSTGIIVFKDHLYFISAAEGGGGGRMTRMCIKQGGCLDAITPNFNDYTNLNTEWLRRFGQKGYSDSVNLENGIFNDSATNELVGVTALAEYDNDGTGGNASQLYIANGGSFTGTLGQPRTTHSDGGILRTKPAYSGSPQHPRACTSTATCDSYWQDITPDSILKWNSYVSIPYPRNAQTDGSCNTGGTTQEWDCLSPQNKITPAIKAIPYMKVAPNGDLYIARNACKVTTVCFRGAANSPPGSCDFAIDKQVCPKGYEIPQLWVLPQGSPGFSKGASDWLLVAESPSSNGRTDMSGNNTSANDCNLSAVNRCDTENTHISLLEFNGSYLYIGFDNDQYGVNIWRVDMAAKASGSRPAESEFSRVSDFGLDAGSNNSKIFWHQTVKDVNIDYLLVVTRNGTSAMKIYRTNNQ